MKSDQILTVSGWHLWTARFLTSLVTLAFLGSAGTKLFHTPKVVEELTRSGFPKESILPIGILELSLLLLYLFQRTSVLGTFLLTGYMGGAIVTHIVGRQTFVPPLLVGVVMFAASYFRNAPLRQLVPVSRYSKLKQSSEH